MREVKGNIWDVAIEQDFDYLCIPTNGYINTKGECVMGRGVALQAKQIFPEIPKILAAHIRAKGNVVNKLGKRIFSFPTKHTWSEKSDINLIKKSCIELMSMLGEKERVLLPRPGCGNGGLLWEEVKKEIENLLDDRVYIISR